MTRKFLVPLLLAVTAVTTPAAHAEGETVEVDMHMEWLRSGTSYVLVVVCATHASAEAAVTVSRCEVDGTHWVVDAGGVLAQDVSETWATGSEAVSIWEGSARDTTEVCASGSAIYNRTSGTPLTVTATPFCVTIGS